MAGDLKFSAHLSGYAQIGPTQRMRTRLSADDRYALSRTQLDPVHGGVVLRLVFHRSELRPRQADANELTIDLHDDEEALLLLVMVGPLPGDLPQGCRTVGSVARRSTEPVYLVAGPFEPGPRLLEEALEVLNDPGQPWRLPVDWTYDLHAVLEVDDGSPGPPLLTEIADDDLPPDRLPAPLEGCPGEVLLFDELPIPPPGGIDLCAAVWVDEAGQVRIYVNDRARCNHAHLGADVARLVAAFKESGPDQGWTPLEQHRVEGGGWITAVATRAALERTQRPRS